MYQRKNQTPHPDHQKDDSIIYDLHVTKYATDGPERMVLSAQEWIC